MRRTALAAGLSLLALTACGPGSGAPDAAQPEPWFADIDLAAYLDCARERDVTLLQAHRAGDRPGAAENSITAIDASLADGAVFIEMDVARTADGVVMALEHAREPLAAVQFHPESIMTLAGGTGMAIVRNAVASLTGPRAAEPAEA